MLFQSWALGFLFSVSLLANMDKHMVLGMHIAREEESLLTNLKSHTSGNVAYSSQLPPTGKVKQQIKQVPSSPARSLINKKISCKMPDVIDNAIIARSYDKMKSTKSLPSSSERTPVHRGVQSTKDGGAMSGSRAEVVPQKQSLWTNLISLGGSKKTFDWPLQVLQKAPNGAEAVEEYIRNFNPEAFTQYIAAQENKNKRFQLSSLKQLTEANENKSPKQIVNMIQTLEPVLHIQSMRYIDNGKCIYHNSPERYIDDLDVDEKVSNIAQRHLGEFIDDEVISRGPQPVPEMSKAKKQRTQQTILNALENYLKHHGDFSEPERYLWMFYRTLKDRLCEDEKEGKYVYDLFSLGQVADKIFKEGSQRRVSRKTDSRIIQNIVKENINLILSARLKGSIRDRDITEDDALYIRQCLGSVHTFTLKDKRSNREPLKHAINNYYATIHQRYSDFPELRYLAYRLHEEYNSRFDVRHDIDDVDIPK